MTETPDAQSDSQTQAAPATSGTSPADADHEGGTTAPEGQSIAGISDDQLPEDLQPTDDNPLAKPLDPDDEKTKSPEELDMDATQDGGDEGDADTRRAADQTESGEAAQGAGLAEG